MRKVASLCARGSVLLIDNNGSLNFNEYWLVDS